MQLPHPKAFGVADSYKVQLAFDGAPPLPSPSAAPPPAPLHLRAPAGVRSALQSGCTEAARASVQPLLVFAPTQSTAARNDTVETLCGVVKTVRGVKCS